MSINKKKVLIAMNSIMTIKALIIEIFVQNSEKARFKSLPFSDSSEMW